MSLVESRVGPAWTLVLTLSRVDKLNALSRELIGDLTSAAREAARRAARGDVRAVIVESATPKAFCAGADLAERLAMDETEVEQALDALRAMTDALAAIPVPTIAVLEGVAFGGGLELALACDLRVGAPSSKLGLTETKLAILPGAGGTQRLPRLIGEAKAKEMIFLAKILGGEEAAACGLLHACVDKPRDTARAWAETIAGHGPLGVLNAKSAIDGGRGRPLADALDWERACYQRVLRSEDRTEGLKAFVEKRPPVYKGK